MRNPASSRSLAARRAPFVAAVARGLRRANTDARGGPAEGIVVGVSGGGDSTALLAALNVLTSRRRPLVGSVYAVHVHHHLRDTEADGDAEQAQRLAERLAIPFVLRHIEPAREAGNRADAARRLRYDALAEVARDVGAPWVAAAHHADDQFETVLLAMARGTGLAGLGGMPNIRPLTDGVHLVRPLLHVTHDECLDYCALAGLPFRHDASNDDVRTARGRLRREVMPVLESMFPGAAHRAARAAESIRAVRQNIDPSRHPSSRHVWSRAELAAHGVESIGHTLRTAARSLVPADRLSRRLVTPVAECIARTGDRRPRTFHWPGHVTVRVTARDVAIVIGDPNA